MNRRPVYLYEAEGAHVLVRGPVRDFLRDNRVPARRSPMDRGWWVRRERVPDLVALLEVAGYVVRPRGVRP